MTVAVFHPMMRLNDQVALLRLCWPLASAAITIPHESITVEVTGHMV